MPTHRAYAGGYVSYPKKPTIREGLNSAFFGLSLLFVFLVCLWPLIS